MKNFLLLIALIFSFAFDAAADTPELDAISTVICAIVNYSHSIGGTIMTVVIIGAALLEVFGIMPWPALVALGIFTVVFFSAPAIVKVIAPDTAKACCPKGQTWDSISKTCKL